MGYKLPKNFQDKIELDNQMDEMLSEKIVDLGEYAILKDERDLTRWSCIEFIKIQRGKTDGSAA